MPRVTTTERSRPMKRTRNGILIPDVPIMAGGNLPNAVKGVSAGGVKKNPVDVPLETRQTSFLFRYTGNVTPLEALNYMRANNVPITLFQGHAPIEFPSNSDQWAKCFGWRSGLFTIPLASDSNTLVSSVYASVAPSSSQSAYLVFTDDNDNLISDPIEVTLQGIADSDTTMSLSISHLDVYSWYNLSLDVLAINSKYRFYVISPSINATTKTFNFYFPNPDNPSNNIPSSFVGWGSRLDP